MKNKLEHDFVLRIPKDRAPGVCAALLRSSSPSPALAPRLAGTHGAQSGRESVLQVPGYGNRVCHCL